MDNDDDGTELQVVLQGNCANFDFFVQEKLYQLLSRLQKMCSDIPSQYQQRISYDLLSQLASSLAQVVYHVILLRCQLVSQGQIVQIVRMLTEVQQATEKHLFQQRLQFIGNQKAEKQEALQQNKSQSEVTALEQRLKEELRQHDMKLITQLDQKVSDQQVTLQRAGVPGFYVTNNPTEIRVQMYILDFILKIGDHQTWSS